VTGKNHNLFIFGFRKSMNGEDERICGKKYNSQDIIFFEKP